MLQRFALLVTALALFATISADAASSVTLKVYQGYNFASGAISKSGAADADISFYVNRGRRNAFMFELGAMSADKIKEFGGSKPGASDFAGSASWNDTVNAPSPGYYGVVAKDGNRYTVRVLAFKNQGKAAAHWELSFTWERLR